MSRFSLVEYGIPVDLVCQISQQHGLSDTQVCDMINSASRRIRRLLRLSSDPLSVGGNQVKASDIAGILRISPQIEVEIAPKFLGLDSENSRWREDFFFLAMLSTHGRLLATDRLTASSGDRGDLHTLVARAMVDMYWKNYRRPLRTYKTEYFEDFALDGDIDAEDLVFPEVDGFKQSAIVYDRTNPYNAVILTAAKKLLPNVRDPSVLSQLERMIQSLSPQSLLNVSVLRRKLPSRARNWQSLYDLSVDVINGFGLTFTSGSAFAPGYVLETWRVWQDFFDLVLRLGFGPQYVKRQVATPLGTRYRFERDGMLSCGRIAYVRPDSLVFHQSSGNVEFIADAKYKGNSEPSRELSISEADLYESLAFATATGCNTVLLVYPAQPSQTSVLGRAVMFEKIQVNNVKVLGVEVDTAGISSTSGLSRFTMRCVADLKRALIL